MSADAVVIGGGPAGCASARLLATWGHRVRLLTRTPDRTRGLAESLPPSTHKLLAQIGILEAVERAGFYQSTGNTVFWASREPRIEMFEGSGFQVFRPDFDALMLASARDAGVEIRDQHVGPSDFQAKNSEPIVLDCSGRVGVIARRYRISQSEHRTVAGVGVWERDDGWPLPDQTHTVVETFAGGWAWSVPTAARVRHVGVMLDRPIPYGEAIQSTDVMRHLVAGARLQRTFACDSSLYKSRRYAEPGMFLVGDAGSFIDPLSSFGVKKALASAWMAAVAVHTCLIDPSRRDIACAYVDRWEAEIYDEHLRRSRDFARAAVAAHPHPFWTRRADVHVPDAAQAPDAADVSGAFEQIKAADEIDFAMADGVRFELQPAIRGHEIVMETALSPPGDPTALRFAQDVDLVALAGIACRHRRVPDVYEAYCRTLAPAPLPNVLAALSLLVGKGILHATSANM